MGRPIPIHTELDESAWRRPDTRIHFPDDEVSISAADLATGSGRVAGALRSEGSAPGEIVGILSPTSPEFLLAFFGVLRTGAAASPLPLPTSLADSASYAKRLARILQEHAIRLVVLPSHFLQAWPEVGDSLEGVRVLDPRDLLGGSVGQEGPAAMDSMALLQHTSGTTGAPKGVMLTHGNLVSGTQAIVKGIRVSSDDVNGQWIPLFHDMGLIGAIAGIVGGVEQYLWPPWSFIRDPAGWLRSFAEVGATIFAGPNFAYEYMAASVGEDEASGLDLSRWRIAFNGSESIDPATVQRFLDRFGVSGFRPSAMFPVYGLGEATLAVSFPAPGSLVQVDWVDGEALAKERQAIPVDRDDATARGLVSVGKSVAGMSVRIINQEGERAAERQVGEVRVRGPSVMVGYHLSPQATAEAFVNGWLRTGDLGYMAEGNLYIAGRLKDLILVRGANVYPESVESVVRSVPGVYRGRCVAFGVREGGTERVTVVLETTVPMQDHADLAARVRRAITRQLGQGNVEVHTVERASIPRTTSGKLRRLETRNRLLSGTLRKAKADASAPADAHG